MSEETVLSPLKKRRFFVFLAPFLKLFEVAAELLTPFLTRDVIDEGITRGDLGVALRYGGIMLGLAGAGFVITLLAQYLAARVAADYGYDLRQAIFKRLQSSSERQLDGYGREKILTLLDDDAASLQNGVNMGMRLALRPPFLLLGTLILAFVIDVRAGFVFLGFLVLASAVIAFVIAHSPRRYAAIQEGLDRLGGMASDAWRGARPIRAFGKQTEERARFQGGLEKQEKADLALARLNAWLNPLTFFAVNLALILVVYLGGLRSGGAGGLTSGDIASLMALLTSSLAALVMFSRLIVSLDKALASKKRVDAFFATPGDIVSGTLPLPQKGGVGPYLRFVDVSMTYGAKGDALAVRHLSFELAKGSSLGLIGGTGSGKSTTLALLERLYEPSSGSILYDGEPLAQYDLTSLRRRFSYVPQKPAVFAGTIRSNLLLGDPSASEDRLWAVLKESQADGFVASFPEGLDHLVEEGGKNLSGGQKQRLLLARAFLHGGDLLLLDEATSSLDALTEKAIRAHLQERRDLTEIVVSSRVSAVAGCDLILVYDGGTIVARGSHEELLRDSPIYRQMRDLQRGITP